MTHSLELIVNKESILWNSRIGLNMYWTGTETGWIFENFFLEGRKKGDSNISGRCSTSPLESINGLTARIQSLVYVVAWVTWSSTPQKGDIPMSSYLIGQICWFEDPTIMVINSVYDEITNLFSCSSIVKFPETHHQNLQKDKIQVLLQIKT